jgi:hypothetical protein
MSNYDFQTLSPIDFEELSATFYRLSLARNPVHAT